MPDQTNHFIPLFARTTHCLTRDHGLARNISIVLAIKLALLVAIKFAFFNHPQATRMSMPPAEVAHALLSASALNSSQGE